MPETQNTVTASPSAVSYLAYANRKTNKTSDSGTSFSDVLSSAVASRADSTATAPTFDTSSLISSMMNSVMSSLSPSMGQTSSVGSGAESQMMMMLFMMLLLKQQQAQTQAASPVTVNDVLNSADNAGQQYVPSVSADTAGTGGNVTADGNIPSAPSVAVNPPIINRVGNRSAVNYRAVVDQFNVETNSRYKVNKYGHGETYCNIFMWDVTRAMGAEIPHYINSETGEPMYYPSVKGATELNANATQDWLKNYGKKYGWVEVSAEQAQTYANKGMPAVTSWKNPGGTGHVQVVVPSKNGGYDSQKGVAVAQAGRKLYNYTYASEIFGKNTLNKVRYFVHI